VKIRRSFVSLFVIAAALVVTAASAQTLTVYSSGPGSLAKALVAGYQKAHPGSKIDLFASSTGKVMARLAAEQSNPHADVVILADWTAGLNLQQQGDVLPYRPAALLDTVRPELRASGDFVPLGGDMVSIVVNTDVTPKAQMPKDWFDLTGPSWKNEITMPDPTLSGTAADFVLTFVSRFGDKAWTFFQALKAEGTLWPGPNAAALNPVEVGSRRVVLAGVGHTALKAQKAGNALALIYPSSGTVLIPRPILILKSTKHAAEAKAFVDYAMSDAGQQLVAKALLIPARQDVAPNAVWKGFDSVPTIKVDWQKLASEHDSVMSRFRTTILGR